MLKIDPASLNTESKENYNEKQLFETKDNFFRQFKNLDKILQANEARKSKNSLLIDTLNKSRLNNLLPKKIGVIKQQGDIILNLNLSLI